MLDLFSHFSFNAFSLSVDSFHLLAQAVPSPDDLTQLEVVGDCLSATVSRDSAALSCSSTLSQYTAQQWDNIWNLKVGNASPEFVAVMNISRYIAGPAIALWGITAMRDLYRNGFQDGWQRLAAVVILVFVLYGNQASIMRQTTLAVRSLMNYQNERVLDVANSGAQYETRLAEIVDYEITSGAIREFRSQCNGMTTNKAMLACLEEADAMAQSAVDDFEENHAGGRLGAKLTDFVEDIISEPKEAIKTAVQVGGAVVLGAPVAGGISLVGGHLANSSASIATQGILAGMNYVAQNVVELSWLLTAIIVPIPLALSFYPGGNSALVGWSVGYLTIGLFKINLNLATSLIVSMIYERGPGAPTSDLMLLSVGVIFIASLMTAGGGIAIFNGIMTAITSVTLGVARVATKVASAGILG